MTYCKRMKRETLRIILARELFGDEIDKARLRAMPYFRDWQVPQEYLDIWARNYYMLKYSCGDWQVPQEYLDIWARNYYMLKYHPLKDCPYNEEG